ncbi:DUF5666 domain-containing protein [Photobacterium makurazakiensis]|uniref:DUF5666 domain-containing protein n=1 Tax=Photobacterium makurazakiensis TaxID=2910234 RepID=UPI003D0CF56C
MNKFPYLMLCSLLIGCGGDGDSSADSGNPSQEGSARINGTVDDISYDDESLTVNNNQLDGSSASISYHDSALDFNEVTAGMIVEVTRLGSSAQSISLEPMTAGPVTGITDTTISVNGVEYNYPANGLVVGDWVMVFAQMQPDGNWKVSSINKTDAGTLAEIEGKISALDEANSEFILATVTIDYSNAVIDDNQSLQNGLWVEVFGQFVDSQFVASSIDPRNNDDFNGTELEGIITWVSEDKSEFEVAGHIRVLINQNTLFDDGSINSLIIGVVVELDLVESEGGLIATRIDFEDQIDVPSNLEFNVEGEANYTNGQLSINGINFVIDASTEFDDGVTLGNLNGQWVELDGKALNGQFVLKEIESERKDNEISLEGPVDNNTLWGYTSSTSSLAQFNGQWVDIECQRAADNDLTQCRLDPD